MDSTTGEPDVNRRRVRQQEVVAELGQQALDADDLDQLMHDASVAVAETLGNDYAKVLELLPGGDEVLLRAGVGWRDGLVGCATVPTDCDSQAGYTLRDEDPVIVEDLSTEDRFSGPELLTSHDVVSGISVVIGSVDDPWGVLGTHTTERREFDEHDADFLLSVANILASAIENEQAKSELEDVYGRISDAFFALDEEWRFTYINDRAHEVINPEDRDLVGENVWDAFPAAVSREFKPKYERALYEQETVSFEEYYPDPLDSWFEVRAYPSDSGLSVYFNDITERKAREQALERSEQRYRTLAEEFPNGIITLFDDDLRYNLAAGRAFDYLSVSPDDVEGATPKEVWGEETGELLEPALQAAIDGEKRRVELSYVGRDWVVYVVPVSDEGGDVFSGMTMAQDITEQKQRERDLERALDLLNHTEQIAEVAGWEVDPETMVVYWSDHLFDILDVDFDDQPTLEQALDVYHTPADRETVENAVTEALESGESFDVVVRFPRPGGDVGHLRVIGDPEMEGGEVVSLRGAVQDITEQRARERQLESLVDELEESNERLEQFAYAASHDLREPLRMVSSYLQLIERREGDDFDEETREFFEFAVDGADRMSEMIQGLLEYSRVETRGDPLEPTDLEEVVDDVLDDLQFRIEDTDATVTVDPLPTVEGDASQLRQLFQNLIDNAIEYSGDDPPRVRLEAERSGEQWRIAVHDEGIGIDPDQTDRAFQIFQRLHTQAEHAGTGIGLALCERIVERHGGEIWVDSEPGEGSTFSFTLPAVDEE